MTDEQNKKRILLQLSKGVTTPQDLKTLVAVLLKEYKTNGKTILDFIEWEAYSELQRRLSTSVFSETGKSYPAGFKKYCIYGELHNTKLFIQLVKKIIALGKQHGDITQPKFYGQADAGYIISLETIVHILFRHNESINSFLNPDSKTNGNNPASFGFGALAAPMLTMLMALNVLDKNDWKPASAGTNLICHFRVGGQEYTLIRKGTSKEIKSFYPRNDNHGVAYIELERDPEKMEFRKKVS